MMTYDAVVIGSGFGGAVAACRLAQAGLSVCIVERGKDYRKQPYPRNYQNPLDGWLYQADRGLYDVHATSEMVAVQGAGYGGGSLVYANVQMRPPHDVFAQGWPQGYSRATLDPYYDLVAHMLEVRPLPKAQWSDSPKTPFMYSLAKQLGREAQLYAPNLAVRFHGSRETFAPNRHGALQRACRHCAECDAGCPYGAKNTLDANYLHVAEAHGAEPMTECEVTKIAPVLEGYRVTYRCADGSDRAVDGRSVFLCAGAVHSTELLLRCRDQYQTLPKLSGRLGERYSGNGDFLAFVFDPQLNGDQVDPARGPVITTSMLYDQGEGDQRRWFVVQEGGVPRPLASLLNLLHSDFTDLLPGGAEEGGLLRQLVSSASSAFPVLADDLVSPAVRASLTSFRTKNEAGPLVLLAMGRDRANGKIELTPHTYCLRLLWDLPSNMPLYATQTRLCHDVADATGGDLVLVPGWQYMRKPVSVHNLGGCTMAESPELGVTSPEGEVFHYPNLFVLDGGILPESTGVNPAHTIAAVAERNIEAFVRRYKNDPAWRAKEWTQVQTTQEPLDHVIVPQGGVAPPRTPSAGVMFRESMAGFLRREPQAQPTSVPRLAAVARIDVTVSIVSIDDFAADLRHTADISGRIWAGDFTGPEGSAVAAGRFHLFAPGDGGSREMNYVIPFYGSDGEPYLFEGYKRVPDSGALRPWRSTTTLVSMIRAGHDPDGRILATGLLRLTLPALVRQITTFRTPGARNTREALATLRRFGSLFVGNLLSSYGSQHAAP